MTLVDGSIAARPTGRPITNPHITNRLGNEALGVIVSGLARADDLWRPHVAHDAGERARVRLLATPRYDVWLLGWTPGQSVGLHDHSGANAAFVVVDGTLTEVRGGAPGGQLESHELAIGAVHTVAAGDVHDITNCSGGLATSIHAYSKPLRSMGFYEVSAAGGRGQRVRTLWVDEDTVGLADGFVTQEVRGGRA